jgi:F-box and leucine-rich repeat protein 2/20
VLMSLNISRCQSVTDAGIAAIGKFCEELERLSAKQCIQLSDLTVKSLCRSQMLSKRLRRLDLNGCRRLTDASLTGIASSLTALSRLSLDSCYHLTTAGLQTICHRLWDLKRLSLRGCDAVNAAVFTFDWSLDTRPLAKKSMLRCLTVRIVIEHCSCLPKRLLVDTSCVSCRNWRCQTVLTLTMLP